MTPQEMDAIQPHAGWSDGRRGYLWCRFDAYLGGSNRLRAEVAWTDDGDDEDNKVGKVTRYYQPELWLETNRLVGDELRTKDGVLLPVTDEEAVSIVTESPANLLLRYQEQFAKLHLAKGSQP